MHTENATMQRIAAILLRITLPVVLLLSPLYLLVSPHFVRHEYSLSHMPSSVRFATSERIAISDMLIGYLRGWHTLEEMASLTTSEGVAALNTREVRHMVDVRRVMRGFFGAQRLALGLAVPAAIWLLYATSTKRLGEEIKKGVQTTAIAIIALVAISLVDFDWFFTVFHRLLFEDGTWTFWETDTLIQLYPLPFWVDAVWKLGVVVLIELGVVYLLGVRLSNRPISAAGG